MFAVLRTGGKEYRVSEGDIIRIEKVEGKIGDIVTLKEILMVGQGDQIQIGNPTVSQAQVTGEIVQQVKGKKVLTYKMKRRKNYRRMKGHRQHYTYLKINEIILQ
ncbi:MAG: 50S ribosomal protein L21 [Thermodesulfobacteriota bacterium]